MNYTDMKFTKWILNRFGNDGLEWLDILDGTLKVLKEKWKLSNFEVYTGSHYNFIAFCTYKGKFNVILKLAYPEVKLINEYHALCDLASPNVVKPIRFSLKFNALLLPRLNPGNDLMKIRANKQQTKIAANIIKSLPDSESVYDDYPLLDEWFDSLIDYKNTQTMIPSDQISKAMEIYKELRTDFTETQLLHGDIHHYNILRDEIGWQLIDPKGVIGIPIYETSCYLYNPDGFIEKEDVITKTKDRIEIFSDILGYDKKAIARLAYCQSILSACWCIEDAQDCWQTGVKWADIFFNIENI